MGGGLRKDCQAPNVQKILLAPGVPVSQAWGSRLWMSFHDRLPSHFPWTAQLAADVFTFLADAAADCLT